MRGNPVSYTHLDVYKRQVEDFRVPDRIVVGATDSMTAEVFLNVYADFTCPKLVTTPRTAEMIKYVSNSLLATMISFSNEIGNMCSAVPGVDARLVWKGVHLDRRLTPINGQVGGAAGVTEYLWPVSYTHLVWGRVDQRRIFCPQHKSLGLY